MTRMITGLLLCLLAGLAQAMAPIQHWTTDQGARVMYVPSHELPMVDVRLVFDAGSARDAGKPGLAVLTNALLEKGAGDWSADEIARRLERVGARQSAGARRDMAWVGLRSLKDPAKLEPALAVLAAMVGEPRFDKADFSRERERMLVGLQYAQQKPGEVASRAFYAALYGDHPYATPSEGTVESVGALTRRDIVDFHRRFYVANNVVVAIVGDLDRARAEAIAEQVTAGLQPGEAAPALPAVAALQLGEESRIDHPSSQTHILMGQPGMKRQDPDYFPLYVGNYILGGGGLVSRIIEEIREKRGLSYSAYSYFLPMAVKGPFQLGLQTRNDQADEALAVLRATLRDFVENGPTEAELTAARRHITGGYPLKIDSNSKILEYIAMIGFYGLPLDYLERFNDRVEAVTLEQIRDAFQRRVHPDKLVTIVVGGGE